MKRSIGYAICLLFALARCQTPNTVEWELVSEEQTATILVGENMSGPLRLAVEDLVNDVERISGEKLPIVHKIKDAASNSIIIANLQSEEDRQLLMQFNPALDSLSGKWENYLVTRGKTFGNISQPLLIVGSDERGTMFAIYHFIEKYLEVDPFYHWTDIEPPQRETISFPEVYIYSGTPDFKYRGWFLNDEDLLTEFINGAGSRDIDYKYYGQVVHPDIMDKVVETLVRNRYNLIISASFIDIMNPPERRLVEEAAKRGLFISQHHVEPVGVSAFSFFNYWEAKGEDHKFSFYSSRPQLEEVWEKYISEWAKVPNVLWQIGLRGIADRPMWLADPNVPQSDADRGALISEAMQVQMELIKKYDSRENPPVTTTLWAEGAGLNREGLLTFPESTIIVFADNSPGFVWQEDFYKTEREEGRFYGVYYHHQLWSSGPHLAQGVPPSKTYELFKLAYEQEAHHYAIMNVSNVREFVLGIDASTDMLEDIEQFDPDEFLQAWCRDRFGEAGDMAADAYRQFFDSYQMHPQTQTPYTLDGQMRLYGNRLLDDMAKQINDPEAYALEQQRKKQKTKSVGIGMELNDAYPHTNMQPADYLQAVEKQAMGLETCKELLPEIKNVLQGGRLYFFENNYEAQVLILSGITQWLQQLIMAKLALEKDDRAACQEHLRQALNALRQVKDGKALASRGEWEHWYRGDKKMNMPKVEERTREVLSILL